MIKAKIEKVNEDEGLINLNYEGKISDIEDEIVTLINEIASSIERETEISKDKILKNILGKLLSIVKFED